MKSFRTELSIDSEMRLGFVNITPECEAALVRSGIREGLLLCNVRHIRASVFIHDDESGLQADLERWLEQLAPKKPYDDYAHNGDDDTADARLKRSVMKRVVVVPVMDGKLDLGPGEQIFYGEFEGKRSERVLIKIIGE